MKTSNCRYCASPGFRISKLRPKDWPHLLLGNLPVRCRQCKQRDYRNALIALKLNRESKNRERDWRLRHAKDKHAGTRHSPA
jgi:hypothetical protein